ncbi:MAG: DUF2007 domain-containing protein [Caulobacter sp.]|nr:DUF2007 domain-containing protein [Caulobacter sp.]
MALVEVQRFASLPEAHIAAGMLRSAGIDATVCDTHYGAVFWMEQLALGGFRLTAPEGDVQDARAMLRHNARTPEPDDEPPMETPPARMALAAVLFLVGGAAASYLALARKRSGSLIGESSTGALLAFGIVLLVVGGGAVLFVALNLLILDPP